MFNAFVGGNDIIPDDPDTAEDLDAIDFRPPSVRKRYEIGIKSAPNALYCPKLKEPGCPKLKQAGCPRLHQPSCMIWGH